MFSFSLLMVTIAYTAVNYTQTLPVFAAEHPADRDPATPQALVHAVQEQVVVTVQ